MTVIKKLVEVTSISIHLIKFRVLDMLNLLKIIRHCHLLKIGNAVHRVQKKVGQTQQRPKRIVAINSSEALAMISYFEEEDGEWHDKYQYQI